jgi:hypothetical protein
MNIIFILADDHRYDAMGFTGKKWAAAARDRPYAEDGAQRGDERGVAGRLDETARSASARHADPAPDTITVECRPPAASPAR